METTCATVASSAFRYLILSLCGRSLTRSTWCRSSSRHIHVDVAGNVSRQALDLHFAHHLVQNAAHWFLTPIGTPISFTRTLTRSVLSSAIRFMSMWIS